MRNEQLAMSKGKLRFLIFALCYLLFALCFAFPIFAQEQASVREDLWICPVFESGWYGVSGMAIGGGAALGYGDRLAFGLKAVYWNDLKELRALELNFLARYYFFSRAAPSGLFVQINGGPVIFAHGEQSITMPSETVTISAGLCLGWRFLLGRHFFTEPFIRTGYPYIAGAGLSAGVRF
jgi:hypothetical protein